MRLFDCTLRDGANVVGNGFDADMTRSMIEALLKSGIYDIELGNAKGLGAELKMGVKAPLTDMEYMKLITPYLPKGRIGMFMLAKCADSNCIRMAKEYGLNFLRVGADAGDGAGSIAAVRMVKESGLTCRYSLMKSHLLTPQALAAEAKLLEEAGVDIITIMDSTGTMTPADVTEYVSELNNALTIPVGFHGHNNLGLSQANAIAAVKAGVSEIDCGLIGMARSAGNCATEVTAATLAREGVLEGVDLYSLLDYLEGDLIPCMSQHGYRPAITPTDLILGLTGCHSGVLPLFEKVADEEKVALRNLIVAVSQLDKKLPSEDLIRSTARQTKRIVPVQPCVPNRS